LLTPNGIVAALLGLPTDREGGGLAGLAHGACGGGCSSPWQNKGGRTG